jgi:opine dehydrogenase
MRLFSLLTYRIPLIFLNIINCDGVKWCYFKGKSGSTIMHKKLFKLTVCVCGGGSLAHAVAGVIGANPLVKVNILTRRPNDWANKIVVEYLYNTVLEGTIHKISSDPKDVVSESDIVILAIPHIARKETLIKIKDFLKPDTWVGSFPGFAGFAWQARYILGPGINLFGLQRVPYVRSAKDYGSKVKISGIRARNFVAALPSGKVNIIANLLKQIMNLYIIPVPNYLNICFSRSNSVCHSARMYSLLNKWDGKSPVSDKPIKFYGDWDNEATTVFIELDNEIRHSVSKIPLDIAYAEPVLLYYEVAFKKDLTKKMKNIRAMSENYIPLIKTRKGYIPDIKSYFFTEDLCYGLIVLKSIMLLTETPTPVMDKIILWAQNLIGKEFIVNGILSGKDLVDISIPQNFGLSSLADLVKFCSM